MSDDGPGPFSEPVEVIVSLFPSWAIAVIVLGTVIAIGGLALIIIFCCCLCRCIKRRYVCASVSSDHTTVIVFCQLFHHNFPVF